MQDPGSTTNSCEWTCTGVGQGAYIGVSGVDGDFTLNVAKTGDYTVVETPIVKYENKAALEAFTIPTGAKLGSYVDVYSTTPHTAVYSAADGYYHLDSVDGDVLIVDLNYQDIILSNALKSDRPVMYAYTTDENGNDVKYDIGDALLAYEAVMDANGYYPVTEDVLLFYEVYAMGAGTFTYYLGSGYNEECVWMYCMRTMNMDNVVVEPEGTEPSEPATEPSEPATEPSEPSTPADPVDGVVVVDEKVSASSSDKYVYTYEATEDGTLTITVGDGSKSWQSDVIYFVGVTTTTVASASGTAAQSYGAAVTAGVKYRVRVWPTSGSVDDMPVCIVFKSDAAVEPSEPETEPTEPEVEKTVYEFSTTELTVGSNTVAMLETAVTTIFKFKPTEAGTYTFTGPDGAIVGNWGSNEYYLNDPGSTTNSCQWTCASVGQSVFIGISGVEGNVVLNVEKNEEPTEPSVPETEPSVPETEPSQPETEPTEPEVEPSEPVTSGALISVTDEAVTTSGYVFAYTAATAGTLHVSVGECSPGWRYKVFSPDGIESGYRSKYTAGTECDYYNVAGDWKIVFYAYSSTEAGNVDGTVSFTITFTPDETDVPGTEPSEPETEPSVPETEPSSPSVPDEDVPADAVFSLTMDGQTTYYTTSSPSSVNGALKKVTDTGYVKLYKDLSLGTSISNALSFKTGTVTFDLNGHTVTYACASVGALYVDGATLVVVDTSAEGTGLVENTNTSGYGIEVWNGTAYLKSGSVYGGSSAVRLYDAGDTFYMEGGSLTAQKYGVNAPAGSAAYISGGTLQATQSNQYAVFAASTASVSITGGYFNGTVSGGGLAGKISGGYFIKNVTSSYIAAGCVLQANDDVTYIYKVVDPNAVAEEDVAQVVSGGTTTAYTTVQAAVDAAQEGYVVLLGDVTEDITVTGEVYLDLAGFTLTGNVSGRGTLYGMDSTGDTYEIPAGRIEGIVSCTVATHFKTSNTGSVRRYLAIEDETGYTFHRIYLGMTHMNLKPATVGVGYKAAFYADSQVQALLAEEDAFGYTLWVGENGQKYSFGKGADAFVSGKTYTLRLDNFDIANFGETGVYGQVFIKLDGGTVIESSTYSYTLRQMLETVAQDTSKYSQTQIDALKAMIAPFADAMSKWAIDNLR